MSLFLSEEERAFVHAQRATGVAAGVYSSMRRRVLRRAETPDLRDRQDTVEWWHLVQESLCDAAMIYALEPSESLGCWLRNTTLAVVRRPQADWIGPWFRDHTSKPPRASLETAHISVAVAVSLDLASDVFRDDERTEIRACLRARALPMATEHLKHATELHNYWCIVSGALAVVGAVLDDRPAMERAAEAFEFYTDAFQPDGTYAESLQYQNYACLSMMHVYESLVRRDRLFANRLNATTYAGFAKWAAYAHLYLKPLTGWGQEPVPRAINFGDSAAIFVPSAELLLHIASRVASSHPTEAKLARWMFDTIAEPTAHLPPHDLASFGFVNRPGFLTLPLLASAVKGASPQALGLSTQAAFGCGDVIARDAWDGATTLAMRTGGDPMHVVSHVHGDMNSVVLTHNRERLLVDPGHSCYRNLIHDLECSSLTHSTCVFEVPGESGYRVQAGIGNRKRVDETKAEPPLPARTRRLLAATLDDVHVIASDAAGRYGEPIREFTRLALLCGSNVVFVVDRIRSAVPVRTRWNWLLNNRDGRGDLKIKSPDSLVFRKGSAALALFNCSGASVGGPQYAFVHDAYHPLPQQLGEGDSASGLLVHFRSPATSTDLTVVHTLALDHTALIDGWTSQGTDASHTVSGRSGAIVWSLKLNQTNDQLVLTNERDQKSYAISAADGSWGLDRL